MNLDQFKLAYQSGHLPKPYFVGAVYAAVRDMFEFQSALNDTEIEEILISQQNIIFKTRIFDILLRLYEDEVSSLPMSLLGFGDNERFERQVLLTAARHANIIVDAGANVGWYSMLFAKVNPEATIHAFEPIPETFQKLSSHLKLNKINTVIAHQLALSDHCGNLDLLYHAAEPAAASARDNRQFSGVEKRTTKVATLDSLFPVSDSELPDLIKCDVEGSELMVLRGATQLLNSQPVIFAELLRKWSANFGYHPNDVINLLTDLGYTAYAIENNWHLTACKSIDEKTITTNFIFLAEKHLNIRDKLMESFKIFD